MYLQQFETVTNPESKKRGLSLEEKRGQMLQIFYDSQDFFLLRELEKMGPKKGVISQSVKDVIQSLVDDDLVLKDKIGSSDERETALEDLKAVELEHNKLKDEISRYADNDPAALEAMKNATEVAHSAANRWTDNIFTIQHWCSTNFPEAKEQLVHMYNEKERGEYQGSQSAGDRTEGDTDLLFSQFGRIGSVLDATSNEPWGPHGSALSEIAQATKKFTECQMVMSVLWTRLTDTGKNWRHVYKALAVIEYLVANGSERAVDDIIEHSFQISSLSSFEFTEPNGKDVGINVRKKVETILSLLNDKDKIQEVRNKASANRDKYFGLSSTGITYKSSSASSGDRYGGFGSSREGETFSDSYKDRDQYGVETDWRSSSKDGDKSGRSLANENEDKSNEGTTLPSRKKDGVSSSSAKPSAKLSQGLASSQSSNVPPDDTEDDFDDFDPRGSSGAGSTTAKFDQVDLLGDFMDVPASVPSETTTMPISATNETDLFADAAFVSAPPQAEPPIVPHMEAGVDLFAQQPAFPAAFPAPVDLFSSEVNAGFPSETKPPAAAPVNSNVDDPFAAVPINSFEGNDLFGSFTSHTGPVNAEPSQSVANDNAKNLNQKDPIESKPPPKKDAFQVKSGIWADSLNRGLIDLNITAPKKVSLADIGIVGDLSDMSHEEKGPPASAYMGRAMGSGSGLGWSGFTSSTGGGGGTGAGDSASFSNFGQQQFGSFK
ncbi:Clathrin interactor EPSIN 1 [Acorus calamus]|uniref:Clathrin interactor EPSIN 1 n=1 Tax=Acorus calamus TaxID=4465 RepID=A0AAV9CPA7_ACOCL|nr:Clathrin interactor EPSIN 1 [Acorus calamus]